MAKKADCPFWRGPCKEHQCRLYVQLQGKNPNSGQEINAWGCSFEFLPLLLLENSQQTRQAGAAIESFRNETVQRADVARVNQLRALDHILEAGMPQLLINGKTE